VITTDESEGSRVPSFVMILLRQQSQQQKKKAEVKFCNLNNDYVMWAAKQCMKPFIPNKRRVLEWKCEFCGN
jgi:PHP family Zn ribbon phosphoesterase